MNSWKNLTKSRIWQAIWCVLLLAGIQYHQTQVWVSSLGAFEIIYLGVGQGDSTLVKTPDNFYILIDTGRETSALQPLEKYHLGNNIDVLILTHPDADHIGGLDELGLKYKIGNIIWQKYDKKS